MTDKTKDPPAEPPEEHSQELQVPSDSCLRKAFEADTSTCARRQDTALPAAQEALTRPNHPEPLAAAQNNSSTISKKNKRPVCVTCHRPTPKACICPGLPVSRIILHKCHILVLQHPHERRRKNGSLPLLQLCLSHESLTVVVARRLGDQVDPQAMALLHQHSKVLLIFPDPQQQQQPQQQEYLVVDNDNDNGNDKGSQNNNNEETLSLSQAHEYCRTTTPGDSNNNNSNSSNSNSNNNNNSSHKVLIVILDATWKYAREMDKANVLHAQYPAHMKRVALTWEDPLRPKEAIVPCRFDIRTPPSHVHLSTAEGIAWVLSALEEESQPPPQDTALSLYATLMKPLDVMVAQWHDCRRNATDNHHHHHHGRTKNKSKDGNSDRQRQNQAESKDDYSYYSNPSHATPRTGNEQGQEGEDPFTMSRNAFFTMGDVDSNGGQKQKHHKSGKRRWKN